MTYIFTFFVLLFAGIIWWLTDEIKWLNKKLDDARIERRTLEIHMWKLDDRVDDATCKIKALEEKQNV